MNPKLEKASWVAGIVSALIAVYTMLSTTHQSDVAVPSPSANKQPPTYSQPAKKISPPLRKQVSKLVSPFACAQNKNLLEAIKTAGTIYGTKDRDNVYASLVRDALCSKKYDLAMDVVSKIYTTSIRDDSYYESVEFLISKGNIDYANRFAERIYTTSMRDKAKQTIIAGMKE